MIKNLKSDIFSEDNESIIIKYTKNSDIYERSNSKKFQTDEKIILTEEQKIKKKFKEIEKSTQEHIKKYCSISRINSFMKTNSINDLKKKSFLEKKLKTEKNRFSFLNIELSRNYILKHKSTSDYNTLSTLSNLNKPSLKYQKKKIDLNSNKKFEKEKIQKLREKLISLKKNTFLVFKEIQNKEKILSEKIKIKKNLRNELVYFKGKNLEKKNCLLRSTSEFIPIFEKI